MSETPDVVIVGAGIIGLTTAQAVLAARPGTRITILEKETGHARHQTGHNSGVVHSGLYYAPGSNKAAMVADGRAQLLDFCVEHGIAFERCGKVVVATTTDELTRLGQLEARAAANGVAVTRVDRRGLRELEPHVEGLAALHVPSAGILSYRGVCDALVGVLAEQNVSIDYARPALGISDRADGVAVETPSGVVRARVLVNCAGLQSDRVADLAGAPTDGVRIMPFRGEYYELVAHRRYLCRNLVYPVPDPSFPFLGVHLTRMIDGSIHAGPNAVPALRREGYRWRDVSGRDLLEIVTAPRTYKLARRYWRTGLGEIHRSVRRQAFVVALQRLCPEIRDADLVPSDAGVRAQAIDRDGRLVDDFAFAESPRSVHVVNAPSPAATASFAIGRRVAERALARLA